VCILVNIVVHNYCLVGATKNLQIVQLVSHLSFCNIHICRLQGKLGTLSCLYIYMENLRVPADYLGIGHEEEQF